MPAGVRAGQQDHLEITTADGRKITAVVPAGVQPGQTGRIVAPVANDNGKYSRMTGREMAQENGHAAVVQAIDAAAAAS